MVDLAILVDGQPTGIIHLRDGLVFGRGHEADVQITEPSISRKHFCAEKTGEGWRVRDLMSQSGTLANGHYFRVHDLVMGDVIHIGACALRFDGLALRQVPVSPGAALAADGVTKKAGRRLILRDISLQVASGKFAGILGTSGAGKSTLLDALSGVRSMDAGRVTLGGQPLHDFLQLGAAGCGYVPQDDIVHTDLTVEEALRFSARLRLPGDVPEIELVKLVRRVVTQVGLHERLGVRVRRLSGGQRKRVSIAAEVLARPAIIFLDEPSSGLDPATEFKLMEMLRELANLGCTVVCTTHVMENVYLFDQLLVVVAGQLVFSGSPEAARAHFGIERFAALYDRLEEHPPEFWAAQFPNRPVPSGPPPVSIPLHSALGAPPRFYRIILNRQWAILRSDLKNFLLLLGQPIFIGLLVAWMADTVAMKLFLAYLATFWFGCSNAAQEIVREFAIYRRERIVGLGRHGYLMAKFVFWSGVTIAQALILYICIQFGSKGLTGSAEWQLASLMATALSAVGLGLALSALVRTTTQAVMIVPLILLPQIVLSGFVLSPFTPDGRKKPVYDFVPSHASQTMMDVSLFWRETLTAEYLREHGIRLRNASPGRQFRPGDTFEGSAEAVRSLLKLFGWAGGTYAAAWIALALRERTG